MSYILDALRKSERERLAGQVPGLPNLVVEESKAPSRKLIGLIGVLLFFNLLGLGYWLFTRVNHTSTVAARVDVAPTPQPTVAARADQPVTPGKVHAEAPTPAPASMAVAPPPAVAASVVPAPPAAPPEPASAQPVVPPAVEALPATASPPIPAPVEKPIRSARQRQDSRSPSLKRPPLDLGSAGTPTQTPRPASPPSPRWSEPDRQAALSEESELEQATEEELIDRGRRVSPAPMMPGRSRRIGIPYLRDLPLSFQSRIPRLRITMFAYSRNPAERFVIIDMKKLRVGDQLPGGALLMEIQAENLLLELDGQQFLLPRY